MCIFKCEKYKIEWLLFFLLLITYAYFYQAGQHNEAARFDQVRAIVEKWQLNIDPFAYNSADIIRYDNGLLYPNKAPGTSFIGVPFFYIFKKFFSFFIFPEWLRYHLLCYLTTIFTINLLSAFCGVCIYWFLFRISRNVPLSIFITFSYSLGTIAFPFATLYFSHQLAASLVFICFYTVFAVKDDFDKNKQPAKFDSLKLFGGGLAGGFAFATEYPTALALAAIQLYALIVFFRRKLFLKWFIFAFFFFIGTVPLFFYNIKAFGKLWYVPYEAYTKPGVTSFVEHKKGYVGVQLPWKNPHFVRQMKEITYLPTRGIFYCNPVLILIFPGFILGIIAAIRERKLILEILAVLGIFIGFMVFNANYGDSILFWGGGYSIGPRHIIPMLPFLVLPLFYFARIKILRQFFYLFSLVSIFFSLAATAVEPRVPFEYFNPVKQLHVPFWLSGKNALCYTGIFSNEFLTENSVAFNIGKLIRLKPIYELIPLYVFWMFGIYFLIRAIQKKIDEVNEQLAQEQIIIETEQTITEIPLQDTNDIKEETTDINPDEDLDIVEPEKPSEEQSDAEVPNEPIIDSALQVNELTTPEEQQTGDNQTEINTDTPQSESEIQATPENITTEISESQPKHIYKFRHPNFYPRLTFFIIFVYLLILSVAPSLNAYIKKRNFERGTGLVGKYYASADCTGEVKILRKDPIIEFDWNVGPPLPGTFSVLWEGSISIPKDGFYTFGTESDDASWLWIDDRMVVDNSGEHMRILKTGSIHLTEGKHDIRIKFANYKYGAGMRLLWIPPGEHLQTVPPDVLNSPEEYKHLKDN